MFRLEERVISIAPRKRLRIYYIIIITNYLLITATRLILIMDHNHLAPDPQV